MRIGSGIASPLTCFGKPLPFQRSNVQASASRTLGPKSSRTTSMSATSQPDAKLLTAHRGRPPGSSRRPPRVRPRDARRSRTRRRRALPRWGCRRRGRASGLGLRSRRQTASRPRAHDRYSRCSAEARPSTRRCARRRRAPPPRTASWRGGRTELRLERLSEGVVLRERQRGDKLGKAERWRKDRAYSRCIDASDRRAFSPHRARPV